MTSNVTRLLTAWGDGNSQALEELIPLVYGELRRLAARHMRRERTDHTLQTTALVHEVYLRLIDQQHVEWRNRAHFFAICAQLMRRIVVDHARTRQRAKRGGAAKQVPLEQAALLTPAQCEEILALDDALQRLAETDERKSRIVEMRCFGGLSVEETAAALGVSENTVIRDFSLAKAWLRREIEGGRARAL